MQNFIRALKLALAVLALAVAAGCSVGTYQRGMFQGYVVGATAEEIQSKVGKPDSVDESNPEKPRWVYLKKTFDPDNFNKADEKTTVILEKKDGKLVGADVLFG
jgi:hypothetical protein